MSVLRLPALSLYNLAGFFEEPVTGLVVPVHGLRAQLRMDVPAGSLERVFENHLSSCPSHVTLRGEFDVLPDAFDALRGWGEVRTVPTGRSFSNEE